MPSESFKHSLLSIDVDVCARVRVYVNS